MAVAALSGAVLVGCGGDDAESTSTTTTEPASQFGSSKGTEAGDVGEVAALGDGPSEGQTWDRAPRPTG
jgi:hypothetical protein